MQMVSPTMPLSKEYDPLTLQLYAETFEGSDDFIAIVDAESRKIIQANRRAAEMFDLENVNQLIGLESAGLRKKPVSMDELRVIWRYLDAGHIWKSELEYLTSKGKSFWGLVHMKKIVVADTKFVMLRITDISELKSYEEKLRISSERLKFAMEGNGSGIWDWIIPSNQFYFSARCREMLGYTDHVLGEDFDEWVTLIHPEDAERVNNYMREFLHHFEEEKFDIDMRMRCGDGSHKWIQCRGMVVAKDSNGKPYRFVATNTDIDERKRIEEKLTLYTRYLEQMNADLKQLAYITTHDLKEPIRNITGFIQLLKRRNEDQLDDTSKEYISSAIEGCHRLVNIIEDLLDYSRIELGENSMEEVNMADVWLEEQENLDPVIREKKVSIQSVGLPTIMANKGHMSRLLQNLLSNAIKYNNHPHPEVKLSYSADPQYHVFSVKDNGIGIDSKYYAHIYKMFKRLHGMDEYEGIGMGLAICKRIIETHKGALWHESAPGMGTTFHFTIGKS